MQFFSNIILRRAGLISLVGTLLAFVGAYYSVQLFKNLKTDFEELLPTKARAVIDLKEISQRLQSIDNLAVLVFTQDSKAGRKFVDDFAAKLKDAPKDLIPSIEYKIDEELRFFKAREALYMDLSDLQQVRRYIDQRIEYEKALYNPLNIFAEDDVKEPKLDFKALVQKYEGKVSSYARFPDGYYATPDGTKRVILVNKPGGAGMDANHALKHKVEQVIAELKPATYAPDLEIHYTGGVQDQIEEHAALIADLELSTVIVTVIVSIAMWVFFRKFRATLALVMSLFMGTFWTFGVSYFAVGYLNANSAFLGSIVIGNGINFGVIHLARYLEERRKGLPTAEAVHQAFRNTFGATGTAALAAGLAYGSLILTDFRGFRQFGIIGLIGMLLCWLSAYTLMPAYLVLMERQRHLDKDGGETPHRPILTGLLATLIHRFPRAIWAVAFFATLVSFGMFSRYTPKILETDLSKLRNKESIEKGSAFLSKYQDEIFQRYLSPNVILPHTREDALKIAAALKKIKAEQEARGERSMIASVQTMDEFIPKDQLEKIRVIHQIRALLPPNIVRRLSGPDRDKVKQLLDAPILKTIGMKDLPPLVLSKFTEKNGTIGKLVLVEPPLSQDTGEGTTIIRLVRELRDAADSVAPGTPVAGTLTITSDMIEAVSKDGPRATLFALIAVMVLVIVLFREFHTVALTLFALWIGIIWLAGIILGFNLKINFLNFIALPITFGIGVDYGVNIFQRFREDREAEILTVIHNTGGAVLLASFTTITGYMSLLIAGNQGFVSFGLLAVAGELTCVIAAVVALPAFLVMRQNSRKARATRTPVAASTS